MNSRAVLTGALLTLMGLGGCGPTPPPTPANDAAAEERRFGYYRDLIGEEIRAREKLAEILSGVNGRLSMQAARGQIAAHEKVVAELELRRAALGPPPLEMKERLQREFGARLEQAEAAITRQVARIRVLEGGLEFFDAIKELRPSKRP